MVCLRTVCPHRFAAIREISGELNSYMMTVSISRRRVRLMRFLFLPLAALFCLSVSDAGAEESAPVSVAGVEQEEVLPDAMQRLRKGPNIDYEDLRDPFSSYLAVAAARTSQLLISRKTELASRPREPLEEYDISEIKLVAVFRMGEDSVAMLEDTTGKGFTVRKGNYVGLNSGRIDRITADSLLLIEQVLNPAGDIVAREVVLTLKEVNQ